MRFTKGPPLAIAALAGLVAITATGCVGPLGVSAGNGSAVVFANPGGSLSEAFQEGAYADLEAKGVRVAEEAPNNEAKLTAMVRAGHPTWDVYYSAPYVAMGKCGTLFEKIDYSRITAKGMDPAQKTACGVPVLNSAYLLVYNKDKYGDSPPRSWTDFYDPEHYPGTRGIMNYAKDAGMETALLADGVSGGDLYPLDYNRAFRTLDKIRSTTRFYDTGAQQTQALESGEIDMMLAWPGRAYEARKNGANLGVVWKQPLRYYDALTIAKGSPHQDEAYRLINSLLSRKSQQTVTNALPYAPTVSGVSTTTDPLMKQYVIGPRTAGSAVVRDDEWWADNLDEATRRWTKWVNR